MILPALSAGLTSDNPAVTLGSPLVSPGTAGWPIGASAGMPASQGWRLVPACFVNDFAM
jgi:hypothetical protein